MAQTTIVAEMIDGTCLVEHVTAFEAFTALVLGYRRDPEVVRLTWHANGRPAGAGALAAQSLGDHPQVRTRCWPVRTQLGEVA